MSKRDRVFLVVVSLFLISLCFSCTGQYSPEQKNTNVRGKKGDTSAISADKGMVVSVDEYASRVGVETLRKGGNAVDAAIAVGFALAVTYPSAGNIGGGGFMIIRFPDERAPVALDFREMAPVKAAADMYLDEGGHYVKMRSLYGHLAVGVPGTVMGFELASQRYGVLEWEDLLAPAVELAEKGFELTERRARGFNYARERFPKATEEFIKIFTTESGSPFKKGDRFKNKDLGESLRLIARDGSDAFYVGKLAEKISEDMARNSGLITQKDLESYRALERTPISGTYRGFRIISMPPPSSGGTILVEMLNILEGFELGQMKRFAPKTLHLIAETMKFAYLDRARYMGDSDFGDIPVDRLTSKLHAADIRKKIHSDRAIPSSELGKEILTLEEAKETTHYSVIDKDRLAVATTYTLNGGYGAGVVVPGTGILLNNEMADFNMTPGFTDAEGLIGTEPNFIQPHKRMLSSMTPTIIEKKGEVYLITGSPGGRTIINTILNVIINVCEFQMDIQEAVDAPRIDHEWMPDVLNVERKWIPDDVIHALREMGHTFKRSSRLWSQGDAHSILIDPRTGIYYGAADRRSEGAAIGY